MECKKLVLTYVGLDNFNRMTFKNSNDRYYKHINDYVESDNELYLYTCSGIDGDMDTYIGELEKFKDIEIEVIYPEDIGRPINPSLRFNYSMLGRLKADCDYYLRAGTRNAKHLWANSEEEQISEMKRIYDTFSEEEKPEWLAYEDILEYEAKMVTP